MNFDLININRSGYTLLDVLSGVGGIQSVLYAGFSVILSYFNFNNFSSHLAAKFYKFNQDEDDDDYPPPNSRRNK